MRGAYYPVVLKALSIGRKKVPTLDFPDLFRPKDSQLLAQSLNSCHVVVGVHPEKYPSGRRKMFGPKTSDLAQKLQTWATYSSYVGQVRI